MLTEKQQSKIIKKALGSDRGLYIAVITGDTHPETAIQVDLDGKSYYVTLSHGDFACIYLS